MSSSSNPSVGRKHLRNSIWPDLEPASESKPPCYYERCKNIAIRAAEHKNEVKDSLREWLNQSGLLQSMELKHSSQPIACHDCHKL